MKHFWSKVHVDALKTLTHLRWESAKGAKDDDEKSMMGDEEQLTVAYDKFDREK